MFRLSSMCRPARTGMTLNNKEIRNHKENLRRKRLQEAKEDREMKIIGITGGVGCGKSKVLSWFQELPDTKVYEADQIAHLLQEPGSCCYKEIVAEFGVRILKEDGKIDRKILGSIVFSDAIKLERLNQIVHPKVKQYVQKCIREEESAGTRLFVLEAALLLEDGYEEICDEIWYIYAHEEIRRARLKASRGYSDEKITSMLQAQKSEKEFREACDRTIDNSGLWKETCSQLKNALESVC